MVLSLSLSLSLSPEVGRRKPWLPHCSCSLCKVVRNIAHYSYQKMYFICMSFVLHARFSFLGILPCALWMDRWTMGPSQVDLRHSIFYFPTSDGVSDWASEWMCALDCTNELASKVREQSEQSWAREWVAQYLCFIAVSKKTWSPSAVKNRKKT